MKLADLTFSSADCCSIHETATVGLASGEEAGIIRGDDTYSVTIYRNGGLWRRECCVSAERAEALLNGAE